MSLARISLLALGLTLLLLLGAGYYCYRHLPALVESQARHYLRDLGVQSLSYQYLRVSRQHLHSTGLTLRGEYEGLAYSATLSSLQLSINWQKLLLGEVESITIDDLELAVVDRRKHTAKDPGAGVDLRRWLPRSQLDTLPASSIDIRRWQIDYRAADSAPIVASGSARLDRQLELQLVANQLGRRISASLWTEGAEALPRGQIQVLDKNLQVAELALALETGQRDEWQWSLRGALSHAPLLEVLAELAAAGQLPLDPGLLANLEVAGSSTFDSKIRHPAEVIFGSDAGRSALSRLAIEATIENRFLQLELPPLVTGLGSEFKLSLNLAQGETRIEIAPAVFEARLQSARLALPADTRDWLRWQEQVPLRWQLLEPLVIELAPEGDWLLAAGSSELTLGNADSELRLTAIALHGEASGADQWSPQARLDARLDTRLRRRPLPQLQLSLDHRGPLDSSELALAIHDTDESMQLALDGGGDLHTGKGRYRLEAGSRDLAHATGTMLPLMRKFGLLPGSDSLDITRGAIRLISDVSTGSYALADLRHSSQLNIERVDGSYNDYRFKGLAADAQWQGLERWRTLRPARFSVDGLNAGFEISNARAEVSLPAFTPISEPRVKLESLSAGMFGGRAWLPAPQPWDFAADSNSITLRAENWQLARLVALQQGQDIEAEGLLMGELPVTLTGGRIIINGGYLRGQDPGGSIRYAANAANRALAADSQELKLALDLLSDFHYQALDSKVDLDHGGNLVLGLSLTGKNPAIQGGRAINFNINLEQNLDPLLQSLRLTDNLVKKLESRGN